MKIKLYYTESCPYCKSPINYIKENHLKVDLINATHDLKAKMEIMQLGGKMQVPMLSIDGQVMYESIEILKWLKNNL